MLQKIALTPAEQALYRAATRDYLNTGIGVAALMAAGRLGIGAVELARRPKLKGSYGPVRSSIPVIRQPTEDEEKTAEITSRWAVPNYLPARVAAGVGGGLLGWSVIDKMLDSRRKRLQEDDLNAARDRFDRTLRSTIREGGKTASEATPEDQLAEAIDLLAGKLQKLAGWDNLKGYGLNAYKTLAMLLAASGAAGGYAFMRRRSDGQALNKAIQMRNTNTYSRRPSEVLFDAKPIRGASTEDDGESRNVRNLLHGPVMPAMATV